MAEVLVLHNQPTPAQWEILRRGDSETLATGITKLAGGVQPRTKRLLSTPCTDAGSGTHVEDLGSRNGIKINKKRIPRKSGKGISAVMARKQTASTTSAAAAAAWPCARRRRSASASLATCTTRSTRR